MFGMSERPELNAVDRAVVDELDEHIEWLWREAIGEAKARLAVLTDQDYPEAVELLGQISAFKTVEQRLSYVRDLIVRNPSETTWIRAEEEVGSRR